MRLDRWAAAQGRPKGRRLEDCLTPVHKPPSVLCLCGLKIKLLMSDVSFSVAPLVLGAVLLTDASSCPARGSGVDKSPSRQQKLLPECCATLATCHLREA